MPARIVRRESSTLSKLNLAERRDPSALVRAVFDARSEGCDPATDYTLSGLLPPSSLKGIDAAVELLYRHLSRQRRLLIVGDFDADGATSTALLYRALRAMGARHIDYLVPNRFEFGYGLTPEIVECALNYKPDLIITVDNGISSVEGVAAAKACGIDVLVTDHHLAGAVLPAADAIVNPNQPGCAFKSKCLAGVGVIFYVLLALRAFLREQGWFDALALPETNMGQFLDLVALGTVADVVPLDFNNRILVAQGLQRIRANACCAGIQALLQIAGRDSTRVEAADFGFAIGPRLNAAGRLDDMTVGIQCLLSDSSAEALSIAQELDALNRERRAIESSMKADADNMLARLQINSELGERNAICLYQADWHQGVVGIIASRIKDQLHRPALVFADAGDGVLKGSGRSIPGIHLRDALDEVAVRLPDVLSKFGGHAMAAGLSIKAEDFDRFERCLDDVIGAHLDESMKTRHILSEGELLPEQFTLPHAQAVRDAGPWGQGFQEPIFDGRFRLLHQNLVGAKHLKMLLGLSEYSDEVVDAIAFGVDLEHWPNTQVRYIKLAYRLNVNEFRGARTVQLIVEHLEAVEGLND